MDRLSTSAKLFLLGLLAIVMYLSVWPVPIEPVAWQPPVDAKYTGPHAPNVRLKGLHPLPIGSGHGPEHITTDARGFVYTGTTAGDIVRFDRDGKMTVFANTGGRPLGLRFHPSGDLLVADGHKGLLRQRGKTFEVLASTADGIPIHFADGLDMTAEGRIIFTDASVRFGVEASGGTFEASVLDVLEHSCSGRVLVYDPAAKKATTLVSGLCFPNGVVVLPDQRSVLVVETGMYRVVRIELTGPARGRITPVVENLPGYPDNIDRGRRGRYWIGLTKPRSKLVDFLSAYPRIRKVVMRLPKKLWPIPPAYGHILAISESGRILADLQDPTGEYPQTSGAVETDDRIYVQSLHADHAAWIEKKTAGISD